MFTFSQLGKYGNLGNQLFQIAATVGQAILNKQSATFPAWPHSQYFKDPVPTGLDITTCKFQKYQEPCFAYQPVTVSANVNVDIFGYFQSWKYFSHVEDYIRKCFCPSDDLVASSLQLYPQVLENSDTCSIHVRRGDYVALVKGEYVDLAPSSYYQRAMQLCDSGKTQFFVFSDDINWCRTNLRHARLTYVNTQDKMKDFVLMSLCRQNIIANSSFSWWAAWLNPNKSHRVIAPRHTQWFSGSQKNIDASHMLPPAWEQIDAP